MSDQDRDYAAIRRSVEQGVSRQKRLYRLIFFGTHLFFFLIAMLVMWGTVLTNAPLKALLFDSRSGASAVVLVPTILWAVVILFHIAALYIESSTGEKDIREKLLLRAVGDDILRQGITDQGVAEKPKRGAALESAEHVFTHDDGELPLDELLDRHGDSARTQHSSES